jgi:hypothetical protein
MSHHFNSPTAKLDGRLNLTDLYIFPTSEGLTVFVLNVGPDAGHGKSSPESFHPNVTYDLNIDLDNDLQENLRYRLKYSSDGSWTVYCQTSYDASRGEVGLVVSSPARLQQAVSLRDGGRAWAGLIADPFVANVVGYFGFMESVTKGQPDYSFFEKPNNKFDGRDVMSIVFELPNHILGGTSNSIRAWGTITGLEPDGSWQQVSRWGMPLAAFMIAGKPEDFDVFNSSHPFERSAHERELAIAHLSQIVATTTPISDPKAYAETVVDTYIVPVAMPYRVGTPAAFSMTGVNGRTLEDNVYDIFMTRVTNRPISAGITPLNSRPIFPYVNEPNRRSDIAPVIDRSQQ